MLHIEQALLSSLPELWDTSLPGHGHQRGGWGWAQITVSTHLKSPSFESIWPEGEGVSQVSFLCFPTNDQVKFRTSLWRVK